MKDGPLSRILRFTAATVIPVVIGTVLLYFSTVVLADYGWTTFILLPIFLGFFSTVILAPKGNEPFWLCLMVGFSTLLVIGVSIMVTAIEGLVCLLMALPLALPLIALGVLLAWLMTRRFRSSKLNLSALSLMIISLPFLMAFESSEKSIPTVHSVVSTVEINAPIDVVWKNVVEFPQINEAPEGILRLGFAYPINAKIEGTGVGAIRYCNFNTGPFVEPITAWEAPNLLAFDVKEQPSPMTEWTPYKSLQSAHLEYLRSQKGQFKLYERNGKTIVEGTTFYTHNIAPDIYWKLFSDEIIHRIHLRVLNHIKAVSEQ